jgi:hypothetical protein
MLLYIPNILKTKPALSNGRTIAAEEEEAPTITTNHIMDDISDISNVLSQLLSMGNSTTETPSLTTTAAALALLDLPGSTTSTTQKGLDKMNLRVDLLEPLPLTPCSA